MSMSRRFHGADVRRLIASVPVDVVTQVDELLKLRRRHPARGNRAEFIRLAIIEKLERDSRGK
jgi:metal-responsive CopG/Arc/MetJ family transcriptional regulator